MTLQVQTAASGVARSAHYVIPTGQTLPIQTLLLEPQRTNVLLRSEELGTTPWNNNNTGTTVTSNAIVAPDGTTTADLVSGDGTIAFQGRAQSITFTPTDATPRTKSIAVYVKQGASASVVVGLFDGTAPVALHYVQITWTAGVPSIATVLGSGTIYPAEAVANGWYRVSFSVNSVIATHNNILVLYSNDQSATAGSTYYWGAQAEDAVVPSSYIKTEGTTITRNADSLYFPFTAPPQAMTVYVRGVDIGAGRGVAGGTHVLSISDGNLLNPKLAILDNGSFNGQVYAQWSNASSDSVSVSPITAVGNLRELRMTLSATGVVIMAQSLNGAAEVVGTPGSAAPLTATFSAERLYLASASAFNGIALTNVLVAAGTQSLPTMRQLAGVV